nr:hypothetical protein [uncultured Lachnoanaerobaculum sp.]
MENIKFNALTPEVLDENNEIYDEALDYAFSNSDIKNIAITGIYGAGKSTVWNTYVRKRELNNVITVSLGKYENYIEDDDNRQKEVSVTKLNDTDSDVAEDLYGNENQKAGGIDDENRVEMQIINQILSQIDPKKIPLSKYCFKSNKSNLSIHLHSLAFISMICSILLWTTSDIFISLFNESYKNCGRIVLIFLCTILLFVPLYYYLYIFFRGNKFKISKISFNGTEADMDDDNSDESVLDRDIKELVYLLESSGTEIVVFEDLDRYKNISIYTKLRELNFILNNYVKINGKNKPVRFIYLLKDGLFFSKNRTKFFDFILPIVPILDSSTSSNKFVEFFADLEKENSQKKASPEEKMLEEISYYVDDMRLLKNIVNEYIVYYKIVLSPNNNSESNKTLEQDYSERDKLFALITLKNLLPNEFELLQKGKGYIKTFFDELKSNMPDLKDKIKKNLETELEEIRDRIRNMQSDIENDDSIEKIKIPSTLLISDHISPHSGLNRTMYQSSKICSQTPEKGINTKHSNGDKNFINNRFIPTKTLTGKTARAFSILMEYEVLIWKEGNIEKQIKDIENDSYKEIMSKLDNEQRNKLFSIPGFDIESNYLNLIRFLIINGLLDDRYGELKVDTSNTLKTNDLNYIKGLMEGRALDIFLDVETPVLVIERLTKDDFRRDNILNMNIFKTCLDKDMKDNLIAITESIILNKKYEDLWEILDKLGLELGGKYFNILLYNNKVLLYDILYYFRSRTIHTGFDGREPINSEKLFFRSEYIKIFNNILISILITEHTGENQLKSITGYVELGNSTDIIEQIYKIYYEIYDKMYRNMEYEEDNTEYKKKVEYMNTKKKELDNFIKNVNFIGTNFDISNIVKLKDDIARLCY